LTHGPQIALVRAAAIVQGLALVVVPTVSTVLTDPKGLGLSEASYGTLFVPQSILAIICSLGGAALTRRFGPRATLVFGFAADAAAMGLMTAGAQLTGDRSTAYIVLLCATSCLGIGFAIVTPTLNVLAARFESAAPDKAVLIVNALLGGSAAAAPLLLIVFVGFGFWWGLPLLCAIGMLALIAAGTRLKIDPDASASKARASLPARIWVFAAFAFAYGLCEQLNASWAPLYMAHWLGAAPAFGSLALAVFWALATGARVVFATFSRSLTPETVFRVLPFVLAVAFGVLAALPSRAAPILGVAAFALAGLGVSALLPLVLSFCERNVPDAATAATSVVFAIYLVGYGIAAFGVGPVQHLGITLPALDAAAVGLACILAGLGFAVVGIVGDHS